MHPTLRLAARDPSDIQPSTCANDQYPKNYEQNCHFSRNLHISTSNGVIIFRNFSIFAFISAIVWLSRGFSRLQGGVCYINVGNE
jgi:hypothetical protein